MKVNDIMTADVEVASPDMSVKDAAQRMKRLDIGFIPVCENQKLIGALTDRDITLRVVAGGMDAARIKVRDVMTPHVHFCFNDQDLSEAMKVMRDAQVRRVMVLDRNKNLAGVLSLGDIALAGQEDQAGETLKGTAKRAA